MVTVRCMRSRGQAWIDGEVATRKRKRDKNKHPQSSSADSHPAPRSKRDAKLGHNNRQHRQSCGVEIDKKATSTKVSAH